MSHLKLELDTNMMRNLFPEGSDIRSQLQQSVIQNVVREMVLKDTNNKVREAVQSEIALVSARLPNVTEEVKKQFGAFFEKKGWNGIQGTFALDTRMRAEAEVMARNAVDDAIRNLVDNAVQKAEAKISFKIVEASHRVEDLIVDALNKNFDAIINKAIAAKLAEHFPVKIDG